MVRRPPVPRDPDAAPVAPDAPVSLRFLAPNEAEALRDLITRCYGDTYDCAWVYDVDALRRRLADGTLRSIVGEANDRTLVGHLGLTRLDPHAPVGEAGQAVVDPAWRGHHLFESMKRTLATWCTDQGLVGMYSEATAAHPYSQKANLALGARETGYLLGYIPATVEYEDIATVVNHRRHSAALFFLTTNRPRRRVLHPPAWHRDTVRGIAEHLGLPRTIADPIGDLAGRTQYRVTTRDDHQEAFVAVDVIGVDVVDVIGAVTDSLHERADCVYLDLVLGNPATGRLPLEFHTEIGYFFGGIVPELRNGDVLRMQHLRADVQADPSDVAVASPFGAELLEYVFARRAETGVAS